jgi:hypothetical protein
MEEDRRTEETGRNNDNNKNKNDNDEEKEKESDKTTGNGNDNNDKNNNGQEDKNNSNGKKKVTLIDETKMEVYTFTIAWQPKKKTGKDGKTIIRMLMRAIQNKAP